MGGGIPKPLHQWRGRHTPPGGYTPPHTRPLYCRHLRRLHLSPMPTEVLTTTHNHHVPEQNDERSWKCLEVIVAMYRRFCVQSYFTENLRR